MTITYNIYRDGNKVAEKVAKTEYTDEGLQPDTTYEYQVSAVNKFGESELSDKVSVTTDYKVNSQEFLEKAIDDAESGDIVKIEGNFALTDRIDIDKDINIDGDGHILTGELDGDKACFGIRGGNVTVEGLNINLSNNSNRAFLLHKGAGDFELKQSNITGESIDEDGQRGVSSSPNYSGDVTIDTVEFNKLRVGTYMGNYSSLRINGSTYDGNHRGITIENSVTPTLTNNIFTNNEGDISAPADSEIKDDIEQEAENPDNNNTFDGDTPKYNWGEEEEEDE